MRPWLVGTIGVPTLQVNLEDSHNSHGMTWLTD